MFDVVFHKEIRSIEEKMFANLTKRQIASIIVGGATIIPSNMFLKPVIGEEATSWIVMGLAATCVSFGWYKKNGMKLEEYLKHYLNYKFIKNQKRFYSPTTHEEKEFEKLYQEKKKEWQRMYSTKNKKGKQ